MTDFLDYTPYTIHKFSTLVDLLRYRAVQQPSQLAFTFLQDGETESISLTYQELDRKARAIAASLQSSSGAGERALLLYPPGLEFIAAFFGCLYAGLVAVPAYPPRRNQNLSRLQAIMSDAQAKVALTTRSEWANIESRLAQNPELAAMRWLATDDMKSNLASDWQEPKLISDTLAFLQYTSGSTGTPKGVMVSHGNLLHNEQMIKVAYQHTEKTIFVGWLPLFHDMGLIGNVLQPLYLGIPCFLMSPVAFLQKPLRWLQAISRYKATTSGGPNFAYDLCVSKITDVQRASLDLSSWEVAFNGAEPVRAQTLERFTATFASCGFRQEAFYPCYGMAETTLFVSGGSKTALPVVLSVQGEVLEQNRVVATTDEQNGARKIVGCGQAWLDEKIAIVHPESLTLCPASQVGEIWVSGANVAQGYWNRPLQTEQTFHAYLADTGSGPFLRTGDLGFLQDGELFVTGRLKDMIIVRGRNHYPQDIELTIEQSHPALRPSCGAAFCVEIAGQEKLVIAQEVERNYLRKLNANEVIGAIRQAVANQHDLQVYAVLLLKTGSILKTSSGKVQRSACRAGFLAGSLDVVADWSANPQYLNKFRHLEAEVESLLQQLETGQQQGAFLGSNNSDQQALSQPKSHSQEAIQAWLISKVSEQLEVVPDEIDIRQPLAHYGLNSLAAVSISGELQEWLGLKLSPTLLYDYPTIEILAQYLAVEPAVCDLGTPRLAPPQQVDVGGRIETEAIAVVGLGCRFPGANNPQAFWQLLRDGVDAIKEVPPSRWDASAFYDPTPATPGKMNTRWGGFLEQVDQFDPQFFGISPREAESMAPQQRLLLEVSWEALENAGLAPEQLAGSQTGVFIGISNYDYFQLQFNHPAGTDAYSATGNALSIAANRLSYLLDLRGPSWAVDTACSSSLVAVHQACLSLRQGECQLALAGGVNLILTPQLTITFSQARMMAADGRCKTFDASADGYVRGEGCGIVVLKRLCDAQRDGDNILAVIRGSAVNQDGRSNGLTAPNGLSQQAVIRQALENAGVTPAQISYVEAHGTGTSLGDPIEVNSLKELLMAGSSPEQPCWIGSVKTNIGHLEAAAGIASLIKVVLSLQHGEIPPHLHLKRLNPYISLEGTALSIPTECQSWSAGSERRFAGVSSFGFGGTNCHVILEESPVSTVIAGDSERPLHLLTLSAKSEKALRELAQGYEAYLKSHSEASLADVCFTANTRRSHFDHRLAVIAESPVQLHQQLGAFAAAGETTRLASRQVTSRKSPKIAFLFTGQGSQYANMGRRLYETQPTFRACLERCDELLRPYLQTSLLEVLYPANGTSTLLDETAYTQPALFALEYALAELWKSWGIEPAVVMGHSVGEYVAACVAGVFSLEDGLKLIAERARLMQALPPDGAMVAVLADEQKVTAAIHPYAKKVAIAAINGPESLVISGQRQAIKAVCAALKSERVKTKPLQVSHAFHSPLMEPMLAAFEQVAKEVTYSSPQIRLISNVTGQPATAEIATPEYWCRHVLKPVRFAAGIETLHQLRVEVFVEIGPKSTLLGMGYQCLPEEVGVWLPSLRPGQEDWQQMLESLTQLYVRGVPVDWLGFDQGYPRHRVVLPTYPWQRSRYWFETAEFSFHKTRFLSRNGADGKSLHPLLGQRLHLAGSQKIRFESQINQDVPAYLKHYRVFEKPILRATAYLEMALAAGASVFKSDNLVLEEVVIQQPLILPENEVKTVQLILIPQRANVYSFQIFSLITDEENEEPSWMLHAKGKVLVGDKDAQPPQADLASLPAQYIEEISLEAYYQQFQDRGIDHDPSFQALEQLWRQEGKVLSQIRLPEVLVGEAGNYRLHPVLLDACFQVLGAISTNDGKQNAYLPVGLERLRVYRRLGTRLWSQVQVLQVKGANQELLTADLNLFDETGTVVAQLQGLSIRLTSHKALPQSLQKDLGNCLYQIVWHQKARNPNRLPLHADKPSSWLIFADDGGIGSELANRLKERGERCVLIFPGQAYEMLEAEHYQINPAEPKDFQRLLQESLGDNHPPCRRVVLLWSMQEKPGQEPTITSLQNTQLLGCGSALHIVQSLAQAGVYELPRLWLVSRGAQPVDAPPAPLAVAQTPLWGLGKVIALEYSQLWGGMVDLAPNAPLDEAETLLTEIWDSGSEDYIAFRDGQRYVAHLVHSSSQSGHQEVQLRSNCTYLITGGLGALGLKVAEWMVAQGVRHLVLTGRRSLKGAAQEAVSQLERAGAQVLVVKADVSHQEDVARLLELVKASMPPLRGIVHAAGVLDDGVLLQQNWERFKRVMAPKVEGTWNLHTLTKDMPLDFFVCFSSAASLLGSPGQGNYAAANTFMDGLAHHRRALGLPGLSINWGPWAEVGMAADLSSDNQRRITDLGLDVIAPAQGLHVLGELLGQGEAQVGVLSVNWSRFMQQFSHGAYPTLFSELASLRQQAKGEQPNAKQLELLRQLKEASNSDRSSLLLAYMQEQVALALGLSISQLDVQQPLNTMGIDSLMVVELRNRVRTDLGVEVPMAKFMEGFSVASLATLLSEQLTEIGSTSSASLATTPTSSLGERKAAQIDISKEVHPENRRQHLSLKAIGNKDWIQGEL